MAEGQMVPARRWQALVGWAVVLAVGGLLIATLRPRGAVARGTSSSSLDVSKLQHPDQLDGHITVWGWNIAAKSLRSLTPSFRQRYPHVDVNVEMTGANVQTRFLLSLASGAGAPDVMQLQGYEAPRYIATGRLADLTPRAAKYAKDFPASSWANCLHEGRVYAIPWDIGPCAVFYKPALFEKYGIDPRSIETWDDYIAAGQTIVQKSGGRTKMLPLSPGELQYQYELMLQQIGGQVFDDHGRVMINGAESRRVMELIRRMLESGIGANVRAWGHDWMAGFGGDTIATYPGAVWLGGTIKDSADKYGNGSTGWAVLPLPALDRGGRRASNLGGSVLAIPDQCPQKEAAWAFIEYTLCTREAQVAQYRSYDLFPAYLPALEDPFIREPDPFFGGQHSRELFARTVKDIAVLNRTNDWVESMIYASQVFSAWADDRGEVGPMLHTLAQKLGQRLGREVAPSEGGR